jgi:hypothetical protein
LDTDPHHVASYQDPPDGRRVYVFGPNGP